MSGAAGRTGPEETEAAATVRVTAEVRRRLLTIQYQRKMAGESVSLSTVIEQLLERAS